MIKHLQTRFFPISLIAIVFSAFMFVSCGTESEPSMGSLEVRLHDAPIDSADEVNVAIQRVEINETGSSDGWTTISEPNTTYNLLELSNGAYEVLGDTTLPEGTYEQIRLILNETGHSVVIDGDTYDMTVPSGSQTGVKLNVSAQIEENIEYVLLLDFDAGQSVVKTGNSGTSTYQLKPVVRAKNQAVTGIIAGTISPAEAQPVLYAIQNSDTLTSTVADTSDGSFQIIGLDEGTYDVAIEPREGNYQPKDTSGVSVTAGETNDLGTIEVQQPTDGGTL